MRRENKIFRCQAKMLGNFRRVAVREQVVGAEIFVHFDEMCFALRLFARAAHARFAIAHDSARQYRSSPLRPAAADPKSQKWDSTRVSRRCAPSAARRRKVPASRRRLPPKSPRPVRAACTTSRMFPDRENEMRRSNPRCAAPGFAASSAGTSSSEASCGVERNTTSAPLVRNRFHRKRPARRFSPAAKLREKFRQAAHVRVAVAQKKSRRFRCADAAAGAWPARIPRSPWLRRRRPWHVAHRSISSTRF